MDLKNYDGASRQALSPRDMSSLNARTQAIRYAATSALDEQRADEILRRAVLLATKLHSVTEHVARSQAVVRSLVDLSVPPSQASRLTAAF